MRGMRTGWVWAVVLAALFGWVVTPTLADEPPAEESEKPKDQDGEDEAPEGEDEGAAEEKEEEAEEAGGELALSWKGKAFINSDELTLEGLRGKLVFVEFFGTG